MSETSPQVAAATSLGSAAPEDPATHAAVHPPASVVAPSRVKVCGITNLDDAEMARRARGVGAGDDLLRRQPPQLLAALRRSGSWRALRRRVELCGVFVNAPLEEVVQTSEELGLSMLQLHGDEGPSFCAEAARRNGARVIKAAQVSGPGDVRDLERFHVDFHLLDARASGTRAAGLRGERGRRSTGRSWHSRRSKVPLILSGGLTAENVAEAIAVARPYAVDTASGTEAAPGRKDAAEAARVLRRRRALPERSGRERRRRRRGPA